MSTACNGRVGEVTTAEFAWGSNWETTTPGAPIWASYWETPEEKMLRELAEALAYAKSPRVWWRRVAEMERERRRDVATAPLVRTAGERGDVPRPRACSRVGPRRTRRRLGKRHPARSVS
jgi:hypothetical protein